MSTKLQEPLPCFYFTPEYAQIHKLDSYQKIHSECAQISFFLDGERAVSMPKSPIGGFFIENAQKSDFLDFLNKTENALQHMGVRKLEVVQAPHFYPGAVSPTILELIGFQQRVAEITHYIPLEGKLEDRLHSMEKRKLDKPASFTCQVESEEALLEVHQFISRCRQEQGLEINISYEMLQKMVETFPERYVLFTARKDSQLIAAVVMTIPIEAVAYYFLPATHPDHKSESPMVRLIHHIYQYFQERKFHYIDLGISSINGTPQESLIRFKENMGGIRTERVTLWKQLD
ncbi:GNAT family N-acetyltransferase [Marinoscillum furvescens]|uniref:Acetyltransferase (GNAT) family protein n=1 Tax=Marinoscillum furvescens DSM 4134 TaxID=1122208 RepID=A0A3D9L7E1_MARFU|nr:GNAT family N-acetyltransferase [Marinoscillum furvescens]REE01031.1 acetyltransferase (GNAT) family protein [Marinoscillum furvescens DSM 4134]